MTLGSLFDGSGGFPLGGLLSGITPLWASEIEPFPIRVTTKRIPTMKHYGDVSVVSGADLASVDIITFGSPCQDLSVAGKRAGLEDGERSNLFYQAIRIIKEMREATNGQYPRYAIWENVPGAFSSNQGADFQSVLKALCEVKEPTDIPRPKKWDSAGQIMGNGYSVAWRTFDAQYWGVPQRRRRIYIVADFDGASAGKVLFESEGLPRHFDTGRTPWQNIASDAERGIGEQDQIMYDWHRQDTRATELKERACSVVSNYGTGGNNQPLIVKPFVKTSRPKDAQDATVWKQKEVANTINGHDTHLEVRTNELIVLNDQGGQQLNVTVEKTGTLRAQEHGHQPIVATYPSEMKAHRCVRSDIFVEDEIGGALCREGAQVLKQGAETLVQTSYGEYEKDEVGATLKQSGGDYGGGQRSASGKEHTNEITACGASKGFSGWQEVKDGSYFVIS